MDKPPDEVTCLAPKDVAIRERLGELLRHYERKAASAGCGDLLVAWLSCGVGPSCFMDSTSLTVPETAVTPHHKRSIAPLPRAWRGHVKSAVLHVISLAHFSLAYA